MQFGSVYWFLYPWTHFKVNFLLSKQQKGSLSKPETSIARKSRGGGGDEKLTVRNQRPLFHLWIT